jgi:hypothetical protein
MAKCYKMRCCYCLELYTESFSNLLLATIPQSFVVQFIQRDFSASPATCTFLRNMIRYISGDMSKMAKCEVFYEKVQLPSAGRDEERLCNKW